MLTRIIRPQIKKTTRCLVSKGYKFGAWKIQQVSSRTNRICFWNRLQTSDQVSVQEPFTAGGASALYIPFCTSPLQPCSVPSVHLLELLIVIVIGGLLISRTLAVRRGPLRLRLLCVTHSQGSGFGLFFISPYRRIELLMIKSVVLHVIHRHVGGHEGCLTVFLLVLLLCQETGLGILRGNDIFYFSTMGRGSHVTY